MKNNSPTNDVITTLLKHCFIVLTL